MPGRTCLAAAVDLLSRREHGTQELQLKLQRKGYCPEDTSSAIERLLSEGLLSDQRFAESYTRSRAGKGYGPGRIVQELRQKGVSDVIASEVVRSPEQDWLQVARRAYEKKFSGKPADFRERGKRINYMRYRGFSMDLMAQILDQD